MKKIIGSVQGRNGLVDIVAVDIWTGSEDKVFIEGIGRKGKAINGGFLNISSQAVEAAFAKWLEGRGLLIHKVTEPRPVEGELLEDSPVRNYIVTVNSVEETSHEVLVAARSTAEANLKAFRGEGEYILGSDKSSSYDCNTIGVDEDETQPE